MATVETRFTATGSSDVTTACDNVSRGISNVSGSSKDAASSLDHLSSSTNSLSSQYGNLIGYVEDAATALALFEMADLAKDTALLAARVETLGVVMQAVGNNAGYTGAEMDKYAQGVAKMGITTQESRDTVIKLAQAQLDLTKASQLARVAQDAAVIGNVNSSEALGRIVEGIQTMQPRVLHTIGLMVDLQQSEKEYAQANNKTTVDLTAREKQQIALNAVLEQGVRIEGAYEAAMGTAGKQILSMNRYTEEIKLALGDAFKPSLVVVVNELTRSLKEMNDGLKDKGGIKSFGDDLASLTSGILSYFKNDLIQISALIMDIKASSYRLGSIASIPGMVAGSDNYDNMVKTANGYTAAANAQREYLSAMKAAQNSPGPVLDPSESARLKSMQSSKEQDRIDLGNAARKKEADAAAAAAAEKAAEEAQQLAERQAMYDKQLWDSRADLKEQYRQNEKRADDDAMKARLDQLSYEKDIGLKTTQEYLDAKYDLEKATYQKELLEAKEQAKQRYLEYSSVSDDPGADETMQNKAEEKWAKSLDVVEQAQAKLNNTIAAKPREDFKNQDAQQHYAIEQMIQNLQIQGLDIAATYASNELKYADLKKKGYTQEQIDLQRINDQLKAQNELWDKQEQIRKELEALQLTNGTTAASLVGTDPQTGAITDVAAHQMAIQLQAHNARLKQIQDEKNAYTIAMEAQKITFQQYTDLIKQKDTETALEQIKNTQAVGAITASVEKDKYDQLVGFAEKTFPKITSLQTLAALMTKKYAQEEDGLNEDGSKKYKLSMQGKMQMTEAYTAFAGQALSDLAASTDQSSRAGFESAKAYNLGAAIMSTASAIIGQLSGPDAWTPAAWARAAIAGVMGAVQIVKIASTEYGGGGSVSNVSAGSFSGGSSGTGGTVGGSIGNQSTSVYNDETYAQLKAIADNTANASIAIGKVADGLTKISDLFTDGSFLKLLGAALVSPSTSTNSALTSAAKSVFNDTSGIDLRNQLSDLMNLDFSNFGTTLVNSIETSIVNSILPGLGGLAGDIFGGSKSVTGQGISLGLTGTTVSAQNYTDVKTSGGWFSSDHTDTQYSNNADVQAAVQTAIDSVMGTINHAVVAMGTTIDTSLIKLSDTKITTSGKTSDEINTELQDWLTSAANEMAKNVVGLKDFAFYGENAYDALVRLSTALQGANTELDLIGAKLITSTLEGANAAYKLEDLMGGADKFTSAVDNYFTSMFTKDQQDAMTAAQSAKDVQSAFAEMGVSIPSTRSDFIKLVDSLDLTTESGQQLFAALMDVSSAFSTVTQQAIDDTKDLLSTAVDNATSAANTLKDILTGSSSTLSPEAQYDQAKQAFDAAVASGDSSQISDLAKTFLDASKSYNASGAAFQSDYDSITKALSDIAGIDGSPTLTAAEQQIKILNDIKTSLDNGNLAQLQLAASQVQLSQTLNDLIAKYLDQTGQDAVGATSTNTTTQMNDALSAQKEALRISVGLDAYDAKYDIGPLVNGKANPDGKVDVQDALLWARIAAGQLDWTSLGIATFANGGITSGVSIAGEGGYPEAVIPLPDGRTVPVRMIGQADNGTLVAELQALRQEVAGLRIEQGKIQTAQLNVSQAGFSRIAVSSENQEKSMAEIKSKTRRAAAK